MGLLNTLRQGSTLYQVHIIRSSLFLFFFFVIEGGTQPRARWISVQAEAAKNIVDQVQGSDFGVTSASYRTGGKYIAQIHGLQSCLSSWSYQVRPREKVEIPIHQAEWVLILFAIIFSSLRQKSHWFKRTSRSLRGGVFTSEYTKYLCSALSHPLRREPPKCGSWHQRVHLLKSGEVDTIVVC